MSGAAGRYVVEVDEIGIFATGIGIGWWTENVLKRPIADPITWLALTPCGGVAQIPCADREEARFVRGRMVGHGIHRSHAKSGAFAACHLCIAGSRGAQARPESQRGTTDEADRLRA